jgi:hypothetical protein
VQAPYQGALWTPGYWGYAHNRYGFFHGYWGPHIGFYGGVNYGFGYVGTGYQGGYWNSGRFYYNRSVNNINVNVVHNVYNRTIIVNNSQRISYNGGPGGIAVRPRPAELVALRQEPHAPPMTSQVEIARTASVNRAAFVNVNHGRPAELVVAKPIQADRDVHPAPPMVRPQAQAAVPVPARPGSVQPAPRPNEPARPETRPNVTPAPRANEPVRPEARPNVAPAPRATEPARPNATPAPRAAEPARPEARPSPTPERRTEPARPETAPRPAPRAQPEARPQERAEPAKAAPEKPEPRKESPEKPKKDEHPQ